MFIFFFVIFVFSISATKSVSFAPVEGVRMDEQQSILLVDFITEKSISKFTGYTPRLLLSILSEERDEEEPSPKIIIMLMMLFI